MQLSNLALIGIIVLILLSIFLYINNISIKKQNKARHSQGLVWLKNLRLLLTSIQQHRGLTMGYINGDKSLLNRITPLQQSIKNQINYIQSQPKWDQNNQIWIGILDHWKRLSKNYVNHDSKYNFTQHCNLVMNMLNLIEDCAETHHLHELKCSNNQYATFLWVQLLNAVEHIGQARAIGTSIAAAQESTSVQRIKLNYLQNCINDFVKNKEHQVDTSMISTLLHCINKEILIDKPTIAANDFFNLATDVSAVILKKFDDYLDDLKTHY